jgi:hypothetical protein
MVGQRSADNSDLLGTRWEKLSQLPERFYKRLADTSAMKTMEDSLGRILEKLDPDSPQGKKISGFLESVFTGVADVVEHLGATIEGMDFGEMADTVKNDVVPAIKAMADMIFPVIDGFERFFRGAARVHDMFQGGEKGAAARSAAGQSVRDAVGLGQGESWVHKFTPLGFMQDKLRQIQDKAFGTGKSAGDGLTKGIEASSTRAADAAADMGKGATEALRGELKTHSPSVVFEDIGAMVGAGFVSGIEESAASVDAAISRMVGGAASMPGRGGGGGSPSISMPINIHVEGGSAGAEEIATMVADKINEVVPGTLQSVFEQLAMQTGSAS